MRIPEGKLVFACAEPVILWNFSKNTGRLRRLYFFADRKNVFAVFVFIVDIVHAFLDHEYAKPSDLSVIGRKGNIRIVFFQRIIGNAVIP